METVVGVLAFLAGAAAALAFAAVRRRRAAAQNAAAHRRAAQIAAEAQSRSEELLAEAARKAREMVAEAAAQAEHERKERERELTGLANKLQAREESFDRRMSALDRREHDLSRREHELQTREKTLQEKEAERQALAESARRELERAAAMTREQAKQALVEEMTSQARHDAARLIRVIEEEAKEEAQRKARRIMAIAIERLAGDFAAERTVSVITLPSDEMKGRIIGREGRNIRAIEAATGVDIVVDDTPESVVISCHNPIRREIARRALERLIADGRIHPGRIEEVVRKAEQEVDESVREAGQSAVLEVGVHGIHPELVRLLGMLKYRYSYAQNVLMHSIEAAFICGAMAAELGLNEKQARRAALLHDIGKALTHEVEGSHAIIGAQIARKYGESAKVVNAIAAHHEEVKAETILAPLVDAADALSGARPGARREVLESYVKRLEDLERIAKSFKGVEKCFAIAAGREMRIIVEPNRISDDETAMLAREIAKKIEADATYPGQIRVTVIREVRATEVAH
ncbi:MAG: ribonuclease Y [Deltaproteobacteria bacterium]|jgi:ribonuclease Y|nr:ribonuclease Y [Deltaproteobacteria bacterium]